MKNLPAFFFATLLAATAGTARLSAQEPASAFGLTPSKPDTLMPEGQGALPLIPESMPPLDINPLTEKMQKVQKERKSVTSAADDALRDRIKLRAAKTKVRNDADLQALWDSRLKARTDYEQRQILTNYYNLFWARVAKLSPQMKKEEVQLLKNRDLGEYAQSRIAPTVPPEVARNR